MYYIAAYVLTLIALCVIVGVLCLIGDLVSGRWRYWWALKFDEPPTQRDLLNQVNGERYNPWR